MFVNSDFSDLLRLFNASHVRYLVIGGYAVIQYAEPRFTADLDLWTGTEPRNAGAVYEALREFGAPLSGLTAEDFAAEGYFYQMGVPHMPAEPCCVGRGAGGRRRTSLGNGRGKDLDGDVDHRRG